ncbi:MAG: M15 family metallopeptidase [Treponemataceae bacterium]|nr:M15 family metallopeptidase [Treponemataceae bacterium]
MRFSSSRFIAFFLLFSFCLCTCSCSKKKEKVEEAGLTPEEQKIVDALGVFSAMPHPAAYAEEIEAIKVAIDADKLGFYKELEAVIGADTEGFLFLIDRTHTVSAEFEPDDLVDLVKNDSYPINKTGMKVRKPVEEAVRIMADAAKTEGITLLVSSAYRSYDYQKTIYERNVRQMGKEAADRESAQPGTSQHQTGTAIDFGSIDDSYAETVPGKWLAAHASEYGFSLSFPEGYEPITGYRWECWHYRYIGKLAVDFQKKWFHDIQQYMIEFVYCYQNLK